MIKGRKLSNKEIQQNQKSADIFLDFIFLVKTAELFVTGATQKYIYKFNGFPTSEAFENRLIQLFEENTETIRSLVGNSIVKAEKLDELNFYINELELLENNCIQDGRYFGHTKFKILPDSSSNDFEALLKSSLVQDCLSNIKEYISRLLQNFKNLRDDIRATSQSDFMLPSYLQPKINDSNESDPFRYFEYLIAKNGIKELKNKLMTMPDDDEQHNIEIDRNTEVIKYYRYEDGKEKEYVIKVSDLVVKEIKEQTKRTQYFLKKSTNQFAAVIDVEEYFKIQALKLKRLFNNVTNKNFAITLIKEQLVIIAEYIINQFGEFLQNRPKSILNNLLEYKNKATKIIIPKRYNYAFDLQNILISKLIELSSTHLNPTYIKEEELYLFKNVFTGEIDEKKLKKICWQDKYNVHHTSKKSLIYLFYKLQESQLIRDITPKDLKKKLKQLFCNENGTPFNTTIQRNYKDFEGDKGKHYEIDYLIQLLKL